MAEKKTGGLEGVIAGSTAISTVGKQGVGLTYRGYSIEDLAAHSTFEDVAYLLIYGQLPTADELDEYKARLRNLRGLPATLKTVLEQIPASAHPMDVLRTGCSMLGTLEPENAGRTQIAVANRLTACFSGMLLYWHHYVTSGTRIHTETDDDDTAGHFLNLLHGKKPSDLHRRAIDASLILYAEHEYNASTFTARTITATLPDFYSAVVGGIGALRGPLHGGANEAAMELIEEFSSPDNAEKGMMQMLAAKKLIMGFGHRVYKHADPRSDVIKNWSKTTCRGQRRHDALHSLRAHRTGHAARKEDVSQSGFLQRQRLSLLRHPDCDVHAAVRDLAHHRLGGAYHRAARRQSLDPPQRRLQRPRAARVRAGR